MATAASHDLEAHLKQFGLSTFRPGQQEVISAVLAGHDCLCIMPTGGGKSLCYQLPAVARRGVTLVLSPLIALMKDQVDALTGCGIRAALINSTVPAPLQSETLQGMVAGEYDLVYVAPERFRSARFVSAVRASDLQLLAVDEAHCISEWGHDFRPDYARLGQFREQLGNPQTIALTATATTAVRQDVVAALGLRSPQTFVTGFARDNLSYEVRLCGSRVQKEQALRQLLGEVPGAGIVYVASRDGCESVAQRIRQDTDRRVAVYHAGLDAAERRQAQDSFMDGQVEIVVATVAFGMGIDKADVRFVAHYNMPGTLEAYYQEAGRAGRDGLPARCVLLFHASDRYIQEFFIQNAFPSREAVQYVYDYLRRLDEDPVELTQQQLRDRLELDISAEAVGVCEQLLENSGALERLEPRQNMAAVRLDSDLTTLVDLLPRRATMQRNVLGAMERIVGSRRNERVYFQPRSLANSLALDHSVVARALRELTTLDAFDYVPPFRGRAVHVLRRHRPFGQLEIDFNPLESRQEAEYEKLNQVINFARSSRCRQLEILLYFGQHSTKVCGQCDNCQARHNESFSEDSVQVESDDDPLLEVIRIVLSGIARVDRRFGARQMGFGKQIVAQMLCGSTSAKIAKWEFDKLSTFGLLSQLTQRDVVRLIDALMQAGLIEQSDVQRFKPIIRLTDAGVEVMRARQLLNVGLPIPRQLVDKIRRTCKRPPSAVAVDIPSDLSPQPSYYWTWRLLSSGFSVAECTQIREISEQVIWDHAMRSVENGLHVDPRWLLSSTLFDQLQKLLRTKRSARIRPLLEKLPSGTRYEQVNLFLYFH